MSGRRRTMGNTAPSTRAQVDRWYDWPDCKVEQDPEQVGRGLMNCMPPQRLEFTICRASFLLSSRDPSR